MKYFSFDFKKSGAQKKFWAFLFLCLLGLGPSAVHAATALTVTVEDANNAATKLKDVYVLAIVFDQNTGNVSADSRVSTTDVNGQAVLNLVDGNHYLVAATSQAHSPTLKEQAHSPTPLFIYADGSAKTQTIKLKPGLKNVGHVILNLENGTANGFSCEGVNRQDTYTNEELSLSVSQFNGAGKGRANLFNVPTEASVVKYHAGSFDGGSNLFAGIEFSSAIADGAVLTFNLNFQAQDVLPPNTVESQVSEDVVSEYEGQGSSEYGDLTVEGVVQSTYQVNGAYLYIPWSGVSLKVYKNGYTSDAGWSNADQNGRFAFYGLNKGVTYYVQAHSGCTYQGESVCFKGFESTATLKQNPNAAAPQAPDFVVPEKSALTKHILKLQLQAAPAGTGKMEVQVKDNKGKLIPGAWLSVWPDHNSWHTDPPPFPNYNQDWTGNTTSNNICDDGNYAWHYNIDFSSPGLSNFNGQTTGYTLINNLLPGNYEIAVHTPFTNDEARYNAGADGEYDWDWHHRGCKTNSQDDRRVTISANANAKGTNVFVYDPQGNQVAVTSITVVVNLKEKIGGLMQGTLSFPEITDLSNDPVTIVLRRDCEGSQDKDCWQGGGFNVIDGVGQSSYTYSMNVATGSYWMEVVSKYWGRVHEGGGEDKVQFKVYGSTITKNMNFVRAGRIAGKVYKPDGSTFKPGNTDQGWLGGSINAGGENGWGWSEISSDGSYVIGGLLPGKYHLEANIWGDAKVTYVMPESQPEVGVTALQDTGKDVKFINGEVLLFQASTASLPTNLLSNVDPWGHYRGETWTGLRLPAGTVVNKAESVKDIIFSWDSGWEDWFLKKGLGMNACQGSAPIDGWCPDRIPTGGSYDFYFMRKGDFNNEGGTGTYMYFTLINSTKSIAVDKVHQASYTINHQGSNVYPVVVKLDPSAEQASVQNNAVILRGSVTAVNFIREEQFKQLGGDFDNFIGYLPIVSVYDAEGKFLAAGAVTPSPDSLAATDSDHHQGQCPPLDSNNNCLDDFDEAMANGDWQLFKTSLSTFTGWGYEIRGLPAGKTVLVNITTPNYPPTQSTVVLGAAGSTNANDFNLDSAGPGGTVKGVVQTTTTPAGLLASASVSLEAEGYAKRTVVTDSSGTFVFAGLPAAAFKIQATASGYESAIKYQGISQTQAQAGSSVTVNFSLIKVGAGMIYGTVYSQRIPFVKVQPDADIWLYDETQNVNDPTAALTVYELTTSSVGVYKQTGLTAGHDYRIFVVAEGKYILNVATKATAGLGTRVDFDLITKPLDLKASVYKDTKDGKYKFLIANPKSFKDGKAWIGEAPMSSTATAIVEVSNDFVKLPDDQLQLSYPIPFIDGTNQTYVLHIVAYSYSGETVVKQLAFGKKVPTNVQDAIDTEIIGSESEDASGEAANEVGIDASGNNPSAVSFPAGAAIFLTTGVIPVINFAEVSTASLSGTQVNSNFYANAYQLDLSSIQVVSGKCVEISLAYDKTKVGGDLEAVKPVYYNPGKGQWEAVGININVIDGVATACVDVTALTGFATASNPTSRLAQGYHPATHAPSRRSMAAGVQNGRYVYNPMNASSGSGLFSLGIAATTTTVAASKYIAYNFPNPFDLTNKSVTLRNGNSSTVRGTYIVVAPTGSGTANVKIKIFNVAGDLVREISDTGTAGFYNYFHWDGRNDSGSDVASGVYYAVVDAPGAPDKEPVKMVVVK